MCAWQTLAQLLPSLTSVFYCNSFYEAQIVWGFGDHQHNWRHHEYVVSSILEGLKAELRRSKSGLFHPQKNTKGFFLFRTYQGKTYIRQMNQLFILHVEIVPLEKKFGFAHLIRGDSSRGQWKETGAVVSMPNRQVWQQNNTVFKLE